MSGGEIFILSVVSIICIAVVVIFLILGSLTRSKVLTDREESLRELVDKSTNAQERVHEELSAIQARLAEIEKLLREVE